MKTAKFLYVYTYMTPLTTEIQIFPTIGMAGFEVDGHNDADVKEYSAGLK